MTRGYYEIVVYRFGKWHLDAITPSEERARQQAETVHKKYGHPVYVESPLGQIAAEFGMYDENLIYAGS